MSSTNHTPLEHNVLTGILIHIIEPIDVDDYIEFHIRRPDMDKDSIWSISMTIPDKDRFVNRRMSEKRYDLPIPISLPSNKIEISYVSMLQKTYKIRAAPIINGKKVPITIKNGIFYIDGGE